MYAPPPSLPYLSPQNSNIYNYLSSKITYIYALQPPSSHITIDISHDSYNISNLSIRIFPDKFNFYNIERLIIL